MDTFKINTMSDILQAELKIFVKIEKYCNSIRYENYNFTVVQKRLILCFYVGFGTHIAVLKIY